MSYFKAYAVAILAALSGAALVHNVVRPDLVRRCFGVALPLGYQNLGVVLISDIYKTLRADDTYVNGPHKQTQKPSVSRSSLSADFGQKACHGLQRGKGELLSQTLRFPLLAIATHMHSHSLPTSQLSTKVKLATGLQRSHIGNN